MPESCIDKVKLRDDNEEYDEDESYMTAEEEDENETRLSLRRVRHVGTQTEALSTLGTCSIS